MKNQPFNFSSHQRVNYLGSVLWNHRKLWLIPVVAGFVLSALYATFLRSETWSARQSLIVRDDLLGQSYKPGRFESLESMKSAQETILEISRKPQVIRNALRKLGPEAKALFPTKSAAENWPDDEVIESVQGTITFSAPNGAEFGRTEVIILNTKGKTRERARQFIGFLLDEIIAKTNDVRSRRLESMEAELIQSRDAAANALETSKKKLREMDRQLGPDVDAMNALNDDQGSDNPLKREISQVKLEKRTVESDLETAQRVLEMLVDASQRPGELVNISGDLIKHQPALELLKKELVEAQSKLAQIKGPFTDLHPQVKSATVEVEEIKQCIYAELNTTIVGMQKDVVVYELRIKRLDQEISKLDARLVNLGVNRADFLTMKAEVKQRTEFLNQMQKDLAEIQGLTSSRNANLLTPVDEPQVSTRPDGMGKKATVMAGMFGGLMIGLGLVMLVAPPMEPVVTGATTHQIPVEPPVRQSPVSSEAAAAAVENLVNQNLVSKNSSLRRPKRPIGASVPDATELDQVPTPTAGTSTVPDASIDRRAHQDEVDPAAAASVSSRPKPAATASSANPIKIVPVELESRPAPAGSSAQRVPPNQPVENTGNEAAKSPVPGKPVKKRRVTTSLKPLIPLKNGPKKTNSATSRDSSITNVVKPESIVDKVFEQPMESVPSSKSQPAAQAAAPVGGTNPARDANDLNATTAPQSGSLKTPQSGEQGSVLKPSKRRAIVVSQSLPPAELQRRVSNVRPFDLVKSAEEKSPTANDPPAPSSDSSGNADTSQSNPFLKHRAEAKSNDAQQRAPRKMDQSDLPVPDQIKKLSETIASFARPVAIPPKNDTENSNF